MGAPLRAGSGSAYGLLNSRIVRLHLRSIMYVHLVAWLAATCEGFWRIIANLDQTLLSGNGSVGDKPHRGVRFSGIASAA